MNINIGRKQLIIILLFVATIAAVFMFQGQFTGTDEQDDTNDTNSDVTDESLTSSEAEDVFNEIGDPDVHIEDGKFQFLSGGSVADRTTEEYVMVAYLIPDGFQYLNDDWQLDSFALSSNKQMAVYGTFHPTEMIYRLYRFDLSDVTNTLINEFDISDSYIFSAGHLHLPLTSMSVSPDQTHLLHTYHASREHDDENFLALEHYHFAVPLDGSPSTPLDIPAKTSQQYWFSNTEIAFSGSVHSGTRYTSEYVEIYNVLTHEISSTKIPSRDSSSILNAKINPDSNAYAYYNLTANHGYACGGTISDLIVASYPDGEELYRLDNLHELEYRWLITGELEIVYTRIPNVEGEYTPRSKTDQDTLDATQCQEEEITYFEVP